MIHKLIFIIIISLLLISLSSLIGSHLLFLIHRFLGE